MSKQDDRRKTKIFDIRLLVQIITFAAIVMAAWYSSQTEAAINSNVMNGHIKSANLHPEYRGLTEQFVPRNEVQLQLNNIDNHLKNIDVEMGKIETALIQIRNKME